MKNFDEIEKSLHGAHSFNPAVISALNDELLWMQRKGAVPVKQNTEEKDVKEKLELLFKASDEEEMLPSIKMLKRPSLLQLEEQITFLKNKIIMLEKQVWMDTERAGRRGNMLLFDTLWGNFKKEKQECEDQILKYKQQKAMLIEENKQRFVFLMGFHPKAGVDENGEVSSLLKMSQNSIFDKQVLREIFDFSRIF